MDIVKKYVQKAVINRHVCAGQQAGAEAAVHAMRELYNDKHCEAVLLADASNAFNTQQTGNDAQHWYSLLLTDNLCEKYL